MEPITDKPTRHDAAVDLHDIYTAIARFETALNANKWSWDEFTGDMQEAWNALIMLVPVNSNTYPAGLSIEHNAT